jgi:hypothetical protein
VILIGCRMPAGNMEDFMKCPSRGAWGPLQAMPPVFITLEVYRGYIVIDKTKQKDLIYECDDRCVMQTATTS